MTKRIAWIVDVQNDFMRPDIGRLYVHDLFDETDSGAHQITENIQRTVDALRREGAVLIYTGDWHSYDDPEIDTVNPDASKGTYPPHCMGLSDDPAEREGAEIIDEIRPDDPIVLERDAAEDVAREVARRAVEEGRPVFIQKKEFSVFAGNTATDAFLDELAELLGRDVEMVVFGVARDVCVTQAIEGLNERGFQTCAVLDATWGLGLEPEETTIARWKSGGTNVVRSIQPQGERPELQP